MDYSQNNENKPKDQENWWQDGYRAFIQISGWIAAPIIAALFIGDWLDTKYQSGSKYLLICIAIAFVISNVGLVKEVLNYNKKLNKIERTSKDKPNEPS
ncbi:MAG: AtpZ/AtpI family protein [Patescibacteria group bacterium]